MVRGKKEFNQMNLMSNEEKINHVVNWIKQYALKAGIKGLTVGVSGGVDSALVSTLCAMTGLPVTLVSMPIKQNPNEVSRAFDHMRWLQRKFQENVTWNVADLTDLFETSEKVLPSNLQTALNMANLRSRLRMMTLYAFAGANGQVVVGTGNKVEDFGVGFYTKYGDGGVDISPIADLNKTEVWALAEELGIDAEIVEAKPTDGLWDDGRGDEDQIGATYPELEFAMANAEKFKVLKEAGVDSAYSDRQKEVFVILETRNKANRHKMDPIPVCKMPYNE